MKHFYILLFFLYSAVSVFPQAGTYYNSLDPSTPSFIYELKLRVRSPYTRISYDQFDETMVANYASRDTTGGQRVVTCMYSGENYVYTPPFAWGRFSREHTWCQSWMPSSGGSSTDEYQDQHHLFPLNQNSANGVRSNHPLGIVTTITSSYLEGKYGKDTRNVNVYEPRNAHKGDAARAILYMTVRYDSISNYRWTINNLNTTILPALSEGTQELATLISWHKQDPPDKWEIERNNYIQSIQQNRNPFIDHPEYVNYINFNDLTKPANPSYAAEPSNYGKSLSVSSGSSLSATWNEADAGTTLPSGYLLLLFNSNDYWLPIDGEVYADDNNMSDGRGVINIASGSSSYTYNSFTNLSTNTTYYAVLFSYYGTGTERNYKISDGFPQASGVYQGIAVSQPTIQASNITFSSVTSSSLAASYTSGNGAARIIVMRAGAAPNADPSDFASYTASSVFGNGSQIGTGNYVVYNGTGNSVSVSGLSSSTTYHLKVYEYNGSGASADYLTSTAVNNPNSQSTSAATEPLVIIERNLIYDQDFNTLSLTDPSSILPDGWFLSETGSSANSTYRAGTGSSNTGDTYSFGTSGSTDRAFGSLRSGSLVPTIGAKIKNNTGSTLTSITITYTGELWRVGTAGRNDQLDFQYSTNAASLSSGTWTDVNALDFVTPNTTSEGARNGDSTTCRTILTSAISGLNIANGSTFYIRWTDSDATSADDGLAIDDFKIRVGNATQSSRSVGSTGLHNFDAENTGITLSVGSIAGSGAVTVQKITNEAVNHGLTGNVFPYRWVITKDDEITSINTQLRFAWASLPSNDQITEGRSNINLYSRPVEGSGSFTLVGTLSYYDAGAGQTNDYLYIDNISSFSEFIFQSDAPLPVELNSFTIKAAGNNVNIEWETKSEKNSSHFSVQRKQAKDSEWLDIGNVKASGISNSPKYYNFNDNKLKPGIYYYRLKITDNDGSYEYSKTITAEVSVPEKFELGQNYPNPFNPSTKISFSLPGDSEIKLTLHDVLGREVKVIASGNYYAGIHIQELDASSLTSGIYFYRLNSKSTNGENNHAVRKLILLK